MAAVTEPVDLGTAAPFGTLAGAAISGTGHVKGDMGAVGAIAPAITATGTIYPMGHAVVMTALDDFATAYSDGMGRTPDVELSAAAYELGGTTLTPGVYRIGAAATVATPVTLDAEGDPEGVFIIQIIGALGTTAATGNVLLSNGAQSANVFWIVDGAVSAGAGTHIEGTILGGAGIAFGADTTIHGRLLAGSAAGTLAMATTVSVPVEPSVVGGRVWFDANLDGRQDPAETSGFANVPVTLLQLVLEKVTIELGTAAHFGALAGAAITGAGDVEGDVGSGTGAIAPAITATGTVYPMGHAAVMTALDDFATAYRDGMGRTPDVELSAAAYELGGTTLTPGVYRIGAAATVATPVTLDAEGDPEGVFIIQIVGALGTTAATGNILLSDAATSANVFWLVEGAVSLGAGTHMAGTILGGATITFGAGSTFSGRALAGTAAGTIALSTTYSAITGTPPVGYPPPVVVAETLTDTNGNYLFEGVQPGRHIVRWDLSSVTSDYRITAAHQGDDATLDSDGVSGEVGGWVDTQEREVLAGTIQISVDLGLVETLPAIKVVALDDLDAALAAYLLAHYYTEANREALITAKTDGDSAIHAATDPEGVAVARDAALAAMDAVPRVSAPSAPPSISYPAISESGVYTVSWGASPEAISYRLERSSNAGSTWSFVYQGPDRTRLDGVANGSYLYRVHASNSAGSSAWRTMEQNCVVSIPVGNGAVYRFWSPVNNGHFFTISVPERNNIISRWADIWGFEGVAWYAYETAASGSSPVYRFWSPVHKRHFFTISLTERNNIMSRWPDVWSYEGVAWHAFPSAGAGRSPVYRFWSPVNNGHFFTISLTERNNIMSRWPDVWTYEGVAYYAHTESLAGTTTLQSTTEVQHLDKLPAELDPSELSVLTHARFSQLGDAVLVPAAPSLDVVRFALSFEPGDVIAAMLYDPVASRIYHILPPTLSPHELVVPCLPLGQRYWLGVLRRDRDGKDVALEYGGWLGRVAGVPGNDVRTVDAFDDATIGLPVERIVLPQTDGMLSLRIYRVSDDRLVQTRTAVEGGAVFELTVPAWNAWYRVDIESTVNGEEVDSLYIGHLRTH